MNWYYVIKDRRFGPVTESKLEALRRTGEIHEDTLVWRKGFADWKPLHSASADAAANDRMCAECRKFFPQAELISLNHAWVCAACKPLFLQRMAEGVAPVLGVGQLWRKDRLLIFNAETPFPDRCIRCNGPADGYRLRRLLLWAPANRIVLSHTRAMIQVGLCRRHRRIHQVFSGACLLAFLIGLGIIVSGIYINGSIAALGGLLIIAGLAGASLVSSQLKTAKIADGVIWLRGAGKAFLAELPEWTGDR